MTPIVAAVVSGRPMGAVVAGAFIATLLVRLALEAAERRRPPALTVAAVALGTAFVVVLAVRFAALA